MRSIEDKKRIDSINRMIIELSSGNFIYSIERSKKKDDLETSVMLLNMMAEEIREYFRHQDYLHPRQAYRHIAQMTFILDKEFKIQGVSPSLEKLLKIETAKLIGQKFDWLISNSSKKNWHEISSALRKRSLPEDPVKLSFTTDHLLSITFFCTIAPLLSNNSDDPVYCITALQTSLNTKEKESQIYHKVKQNQFKVGLEDKLSKMKTLRREADIKKIRDVYQYILENLEEPLLSLKELAHSFGTNEFKLKQGFKQLYHTSVFRFQTEERLKRAHLLIRNSEMSLKTIAHIVGFKSYPHFSKIFKKRYGYNPSELLKESRDNRF